jgi:hypothetical protein
VFQNQSPHFNHEMLDDADEASVKEAAVEEVNYETKGNTVPSLLSTTVWSKTKSSKKYAVTIGTATAAAVLILALASGGNAVVRKKVSKVETAEIYSGTKSAKIKSSKSSKSGSTTTTTRPTTSPTTGGGSGDGCQWQLNVRYCNVNSSGDYTEFTTCPDQTAMGLLSVSDKSRMIPLVPYCLVSHWELFRALQSLEQSVMGRFQNHILPPSQIVPNLALLVTTWSTTACPAGKGLAGGN